MNYIGTSKLKLSSVSAKTPNKSIKDQELCFCGVEREETLQSNPLKSVAMTKLCISLHSQVGNEATGKPEIHVYCIKSGTDLCIVH